MKTISLIEKYRLKVIPVLLSILIFVVVVDPNNNIFYIKDLLFGLTFISWAISLFWFKIEIPKKILLILIFVSFIMPLYSLITGYMNGFVFSLQSPYFKSFLFFLLLPLLLNLKLDITKQFNRISFIIPLIVLIMCILFYISDELVGIPYHYLVIEKQVAVSREQFVFGHKFFTLFYKTSPLLLFPLCYYLQRFFYSEADRKAKIKILFSILLISVVFLLSSTRANLLMFFVVVLAYVFYYLFTKNKKLFLMISGISIVLFFFVFYQQLAGLFNVNETSNSIKYLHFNDYKTLISDSPKILWTGQGINATFYSTFYNDYIKVTELTYLEIIRIWGLPMALLFIFMLIYPIIILLKKRQNYSAYYYIPIAYIAYLMIAATNPLLLSSTGMIVLVYVYSIVVLNSGELKIALKR